MLRGTGKFRIASEYFGLGSTLSIVMVNPAKCTTGLLKTNFSGFRVMPFREEEEREEIFI